MTTYRIERVSDKKELAQKASTFVASEIKMVLDQKERFQLALSGGSTPSDTYKLLGCEQLQWNRVDIFLGDERWVDIQDPASNAGMINRTLLSSNIAIDSKFYPVPTVQFSNARQSAVAYSHLLEKVCNGKPPEFDLILLGLGDDGHTASLFPWSKSLMNKDSWVTDANANGHDRISFTSSVLSSAKKVIFLVNGSSKQIALQRLLDTTESSDRTPARLVQPNSEILIIADDAALELI